MTSWSDIESLPDEVLYHIFSHLSVQDIKLNVALVSKRWNALSKNGKLVRKLEFGPHLTLDVVLEVLKNSPSLNNLKIFSRRDINEILTEVSVYNLKLTRLKINSSRDNRLTDINTEIILNVLRACPFLRELTVKRCSFEEPDNFFREVGTLLPNIRVLNFNHNLQLGTEQLDDLVANLKPVEDMRIYCLAFNRIGSVTPYSDRPVLRLLEKMVSTLSVLKLNMLGLSDVVMDKIGMCTLLKVLHLYRVVNVHDEGMMMLGRLRGLERLVVTVPRAITSSGWKMILSDESMKNLKELTISNSYAVDDSVIAEIALNCTFLEKLSLPGCRKMTHNGILRVMESCSRLSYLNLFSTRSSVAETFATLPQLLPNLKTLIYRPVDRHHQDFTNLSVTMPGLRTTSVYRYL